MQASPKANGTASGIEGRPTTTTNKKLFTGYKKPSMMQNAFDKLGQQSKLTPTSGALRNSKKVT